MAIDKSLNTCVETQDSIFGGLEDLQEVTRQSSLYDLYAVSILNESSSMEEDREWLVLPNNFTDDLSISKSGSFSTRQQCEATLPLVDSSPASEEIHVELEKRDLASKEFIEDTEPLRPNKAEDLDSNFFSASPQCEAVCRIDSSTTSGEDLESRKRCLADDEWREDTHEEHWPSKKKQRSTKKCGRVWSLKVNPPIPFVKRCRHCGTDKTPLWRLGPMGPKTLCNACGVRYRSGRLVPEYRPVASPTFDCKRHSNSHKKIVQMTRNRPVTCY